MNIKSNLLATVVALACGTLAIVPAAQAVTQNATPDGTITINGTVLAQTCKVDGNSVGTSDSKTVTLPNVLASQFAGAGSVAGATSFTITIANCPGALTKVQTYFSGGSIDNSTHNLTSSGAATNVEVQLLDGQNSNAAVNLNASSTAQTATSNLASGGATLTYQAQYYATGTVGAGSVTATTNFTMIYQ